MTNTNKTAKTIGPWKRLSSEKMYENQWISVSHEAVITPAGSDGIYGKVHFKSRAIGIVTLDSNLNTLLVGQHRYTLDAFSWEIPMGGGALDEGPLDAAKRELREETGLHGGEWHQLLELHTSNSITDEQGFVFLATDLSVGTQSLEDSEADLVIKELSLHEALLMIDRGEITDAVSIAGLLAAQRFLSRV